MDSKTIVSRRERRLQEKPPLVRAVASHAGAVGRTAAVAAATSGLVITTGVAANAAEPEQSREVTTQHVPTSGLSVARASSSAPVTVAAARDAELTFDGPAVESAPAAPPEPEPEPEPEVTPEPEVQTVTEVQPEPQPEPPAEPQSETQVADTEDVEEPQESQQDAGESQQESVDTQAASAEEDEQPSSNGGGLSGVVSAAYSGLGTPYVWGGKGPSGWDCSGFVAWAYAQAGHSIPSSTSAVRGSSQFTWTSNPQPGDIVVQNGGSHIAIYVGNGQFIGSQNPSTGTLQYSYETRPGNSHVGYLTLR